MTLSKLKPYSYIVFGLIIIILLVIIGIGLFSQEDKSKLRDTSTPSQKKSLKLDQPKNFDKELTKIDEILPLKDPNYKVEYNKTLNLIMAEVNATSNDDYLQTKEKIENVIKNKGVKDICTLNIFWVAKASPEVRQSIDPKDTITSDCPVVPSKN